jgi:hypothetical protein
LYIQQQLASFYRGRKVKGALRIQQQRERTEFSGIYLKISF